MSDTTESSHTEQAAPVVPQEIVPEPQSAPQVESKPEPQTQPEPAPKQEESPKPAEKSPEPIKQQPVEAPKPEPKTESKGWGWGWGIISSVSSKVGEYVKPALDTVGDTVSEIAKVISEDDKKEEPSLIVNEENSSGANTAENTTENNTSGSVETNMNTNNTVEGTQPSEQSAEDDAGLFSLIGNTANYLGNIIQKGVDTVANTDLSTVQEKAKAMISTVRENQLVDQGFKVGGDLAHRGLDALEQVGEKALQLLTTTEVGPENKPKLVSRLTVNLDEEIDPSSTASSPSVKKNTEMTFDAYFEQRLGAANIQALEYMSIECMMKIQQAYRQLHASVRETVDEQSSAIQEEFDIERQEDVKEELPALKWNEKAEKQLSQIDAKVAESKERVTQMQKDFEASVAQLTTVPTGANELFGLTMTYQHKYQIEGTERLAELSALAVEHLLRVAEFMIVSDTQTAQSEPVVKDSDAELLTKAKYIRVFADQISDHISTVSTLFIDAVKATVNVSADLQKSLETKVNFRVNGIYLDAGNAISNVQEGKKFLLNVTKYLSLLAIKQRVVDTPAETADKS
jgi:hypothetical protein